MTKCKKYFRVMKNFVDAMIDDEVYSHKYVQVSIEAWQNLLQDKTFHRFIDVITTTAQIGQVGIFLGKKLILNPNLKNEEFIFTNIEQILTKEEYEITKVLES